jgi:lysophospholipase L1-like esterase
VIAVSIPAWSYVPAAADFGGAEHVAAQTSIFNEVAREEAEVRGFTWVDITEASMSGIGTAGWIASDELHPADAQYASWAEAVWKAAGDQLTTD